MSLHRVTLETGEAFKGNLSITPSANTTTGTDITLTIDVKPSDGGADSNYIVLRLSVVEKVPGP